MPPASKDDPEFHLQRDTVLQLAMRGARMGMWVRNLIDGTIWWSPELEALFGFEQGAFPGNLDAFRRLVHPDDHPLFSAAVERAVETRCDYVVEFRFRHQSGEWRWMDGRGKATYDAQGTPLRLYGAGIDITERKNAEQALRDSEQRLLIAAGERERLLESERAARSEAERLGHLKDEFLATLSHELRTPLNAIQGWAAVLRRSKPGSQDIDSGLETIERNARAQGQIISDLLDMSSILSGKIHVDVKSVNLHELITTAVQSVRPSADAKQVRLQTTLDARIGLTRGDPNRLQQVLWNLMTNAVKFSKTGGRVHVVLERVNSHIEISIEDTGVGISEAFLPHVFDRFRQADASVSRSHGGLGLGLSIVKNLIELHGGSVRVKSPGLDQGSTFTITLPVSVVREGSEHNSVSDGSAQPVHQMTLPALTGITILVVDDEADARALISRLLEERGAKCLCAVDAHEALGMLERQSIDLLLSDIGLPKMDGYELIRQVRKAQAGQRVVPAIALTAYARSEDRQRALLSGYQMHISKPVEALELIAGIASLVNISASHALSSAAPA